MKIVFDKQKLLDVITPAMSCASNKSTFTSIEGILIETKGIDRVAISTFDMEKGMHTELEADVLEEGTYIVNAGDFFQYVKAMPDSEITLTVSDKLIGNLRCGKVFYTMTVIHGKEFPRFPEFEGNKTIVIEQCILKRLINSTFHSIAVTDANHPELCGAYFEITENGITTVACDSFTLSKCEKIMNVRIDGGDKMVFIAPGRSLFELQKLLSDDKEDLVTVKLSRKHIFFIIGDVVFFSQVIDMKYIDYNRIVPTDMPITVEMNRAAFVESLERAALISEKRSAGSVKSFVKLTFAEKQLKLSSISLNGQIYDELAINSHVGDDIEIGFNCRYLINCMRAAASDNVKLCLKTPRMSMTVEPVAGIDGEKLMYMILPVKMND